MSLPHFNGDEWKQPLLELRLVAATGLLYLGYLLVDLLVLGMQIGGMELTERFIPEAFAIFGIKVHDLVHIAEMIVCLCYIIMATVKIIRRMVVTLKDEK